MEQKYKIEIESTTGGYGREKSFKKVILMDETQFLAVVGNFIDFCGKNKIRDFIEAPITPKK